MTGIVQDAHDLLYTQDAEPFNFKSLMVILWAQLLIMIHNLHNPMHCQFVHLIKMLLLYLKSSWYIIGRELDRYTCIWFLSRVYSPHSPLAP